MILFPCLKCGKMLKAPIGTEGRAAKCQCGASVTVPAATPEDESPPLAFHAVPIPSEPRSIVRATGRDDEYDDDDDDDGPQKRRRRHGVFSCPFCGSDARPVDCEEISGAGWAVMVAMLILCFPLFFIGLFIKDRYRVCGECGTRLGRV